MKRLALLTLALTSSTACVDFDISFDWEDALNDLLEVDTYNSPANGTLYTQARGVVIHEDGGSAHVGMHGTTCEVETDGAWIGTDHNLPTDSEVVVDSKTHGGGDEVLVTTDDGVHVVQKDDWMDDHLETYPVDGTIDAGFTDDGIAVLADDPTTGCGVSWIDRDNGHRDHTAVPPELCDDGVDISVDPDTSDVYVATPGDGVVLVDPSGVHDVDCSDADLSAWDKYSQMLYVASEGHSWVRGQTWQGETLWEVDLGHPVVTLHNAGQREGALVLVDAGSQDQIIFIDAVTGDIHVDASFPHGANDIAVSANGRDIALIKTNEVFFTRL